MKESTNLNPYMLDETSQEEDSRFAVNLTTPTTKGFRSKCGDLVNNDNVQKFIIFVIVFNAVVMGVGTFDFVVENEAMSQLFDTMDLACLVIFTVEIGIQVIYHGTGLFQHPWLVFDLSVVALAFMGEEFQVLRSFRVLRTFRLLVRTRELRNLVEAVISTIPRIFAVGLFLAMIMYVFAVMFTILCRDMYDEGYLDEDYFGRLDMSLFTLFQLMTMDSWSHITKQVMVLYPWAWIPFIIYVLTTSFLIINLVIAVICDAVGEFQRDEIETQLRHVSSGLSIQNHETVQILEHKIEELKNIVEKMALQQQLLVERYHPKNEEEVHPRTRRHDVT